MLNFEPQKSKQKHPESFMNWMDDCLLIEKQRLGVNFFQETYGFDFENLAWGCSHRSRDSPIFH